MFISDRALEHMEKTAQSVGFGPRRDYPHRGAAAISAADWKGASIASCVFADIRNAEKYLEESLSGLDSMGDGLKGRILTVPLPWDEDGDGSTGLYIAVITASDLVHKSDTAYDLVPKPDTEDNEKND